MRIAVTGANGFVGSNLANYFHTLGWETTAVVRPGADSGQIDPGVQVRPVDYLSPADLASALANAEIVVHNAGKTRTRSFSEMLAANVVVTRKVLEACNRNPGCQRLIYISSQAASRPTPELRAVSEDESSAPVDWYGRSKALSERIIRAECAQAWTIVRPASVYGPGERDFLQLFKSIKSGVKFSLGSRDQQLSLIHISELCEFLRLCCTSANARNQLFFASDGVAYSQSRFMVLVEELLGKKALTLRIPQPLAKLAGYAGDLAESVTGRTGLVNSQKMKELLGPNWVCSNEKARGLLGWDPVPDLEGKLRQTLDWYIKQGWL